MRMAETGFAEANEAGRRKSVIARIDRRIVRSAIYTVVTLLLVALFKLVEWAVEHTVAGAEKLGLPLALAAAICMAVLFQLWHRRVEETVAEWLNRVAHTRERRLHELASEIPLIRDLATLQMRVIERLDDIFAVRGSALYYGGDGDAFELAACARAEMPREVRSDEPALIHAMLQHAAVAPAQHGSKLPAAILWPIRVRGRMRGFVTLGSGEERESLDAGQLAAMGRVADAIGAALPVLRPQQGEGSFPPLPRKPSIAVLAFENLSGDPAQEYFADGMVEEVITGLSQFKQLFVIARNSSFTYKGRHVDVKQIGRELGVRYLLEGSVRKSGERVRITGQLVDAASGAHLWADRFDGELASLFDLQDEVTASVVSAIVPTIDEAESERARRKPPESLEAYDFYLRGLGLSVPKSREESDESLRLLQKSIELDPNFGLAYAIAAKIFCYRKINDWMVDRAAEASRAARLAHRGLELGRDDAIALSACGITLSYVVGELEAGAAACQRALTLNRNSAYAWSTSGVVNVYMGESDLGIEQVGRAMRLSPRDPLMFLWHFYTALGHFCAHRHDEANAWTERGLLEQPNHLALLCLDAASHAAAGRMDRARASVARLREAHPALRIPLFTQMLPPFRRAADRQGFVDGLRLAGLPD